MWVVRVEFVENEHLKLPGGSGEIDPYYSAQQPAFLPHVGQGHRAKCPVDGSVRFQAHSPAGLFQADGRAAAHYPPRRKTCSRCCGDHGDSGIPNTGNNMGRDRHARAIVDKGKNRFWRILRIVARAARSPTFSRSPFANVMPALSSATSAPMPIDADIRKRQAGASLTVAGHRDPAPPACICRTRSALPSGSSPA